MKFSWRLHSLVLSKLTELQGENNREYGVTRLNCLTQDSDRLHLFLFLAEEDVFCLILFRQNKLFIIFLLRSEIQKESRKVN